MNLFRWQFWYCSSRNTETVKMSRYFISLLQYKYSQLSVQSIPTEYPAGRRLFNPELWSLGRVVVVGYLAWTTPSASAQLKAVTRPRQSPELRERGWLQRYRCHSVTVSQCHSVTREQSQSHKIKLLSGLRPTETLSLSRRSGWKWRIDRSDLRSLIRAKLCSLNVPDKSLNCII